MPIKIYNEKEQADQGKSQNINIEENKNTRSGRELSPVFTEIKSLRNEI